MKAGGFCHSENRGPKEGNVTLWAARLLRNPVLGWHSVKRKRAGRAELREQVLGAALATCSKPTGKRCPSDLLCELSKPSSILRHHVRAGPAYVVAVYLLGLRWCAPPVELYPCWKVSGPGRSRLYICPQSQKGRAMKDLMTSADGVRCLPET